MLIDEFKPTDVEWCDTCRPHVDGACDGCHTPFTATDQRYRSQSHHFHPREVAGVPGFTGIHKLLCVDCYRIDHERVTKETAPPLPNRGQDPAFWALQRIEKERAYALELLAGCTMTDEEMEYLRGLVLKAIR